MHGIFFFFFFWHWITIWLCAFFLFYFWALDNNMALDTLHKGKKIKGFWLICMVFFFIFWGALDNNMALCSFLILFLGIG